MDIQCWPDLVKYGAREHLQHAFEGLLLGQGETEPEYDVSLKIDLEQIPQDPGEQSLRLFALHQQQVIFLSIWRRQ